MASSMSNYTSTRVLCLFSNPIPLHPSSSSSPASVSYPLTRTTPFSPHPRRLCAVRTGPDGAKLGSQESLGPDPLRKPFAAPVEEELDEVSDEEFGDSWEDRILEETVPLVGYVRLILHTGKYENWDKLSPEHEKTIREKLLPYHPEFEQKIGPGIDHITVGHHPDFQRSRCLFVSRKDGTMTDFSYWKCIKGLIRKKYPLHADQFIHRHFQPRRNTM